MFLRNVGWLSVDYTALYPEDSTSSGTCGVESRSLHCNDQVLMRRVYSSGSACEIHHAGFLLGLVFDPEDGGSMFFRKVC
jgi:hypothetical protein